jgi:hypothetical protein
MRHSRDYNEKQEEIKVIRVEFDPEANPKAWNAETALAFSTTALGASNLPRAGFHVRVPARSAVYPAWCL